MPKTYSILKWLILIASYLFLAYKLINFNQYQELSSQWNPISSSQIALITGVFLLLPLNWFVEALKWNKLTAIVQTISYANSMRAVLAGITTGFFTPNRVGELVGRIMFLQPEHRKAGVTLSFINSITQNLMMALCGIPASILFFNVTHSGHTVNLPLYFGLLLVGLLLFGQLYFFFPLINDKIKASRFGANISPFTDCVLALNSNRLLQIMFISLLRYIVFCTQFWLVLQFFGIPLTLLQAIIAIPTTYLFVTFTPSLAFSEVAVRSTYSVLVIGAYSSNVLGMALAGACVWAVNFIIPMLVGSVIMATRKV